VSRQAKWQRRKLANGQCITCGRPREVPSSSLCAQCRERVRVRARARRGYHPRVPGGRGRRTVEEVQRDSRGSATQGEVAPR
jgi:hypothetical protein